MKSKNELEVEDICACPRSCGPDAQDRSEQADEAAEGASQTNAATAQDAGTAGSGETADCPPAADPGMSSCDNHVAQTLSPAATGKQPATPLAAPFRRRGGVLADQLWLFDLEVQNPAPPVADEPADDADRDGLQQTEESGAVNAWDEGACEVCRFDPEAVLRAEIMAWNAVHVMSVSRRALPGWLLRPLEECGRDCGPKMPILVINVKTGRMHTAYCMLTRSDLARLLRQYHR